jgi:hypothetical protein
MMISIDEKYVKENIVRKYVDCHTACPHGQGSVEVADTAHETYVRHRN